MYQEYGCNKGDLIFIMDGMNVYHDELKAKYRDSLGGIFPMLAVDDNLDSLYFLKKDFPGAAPLYALVSPSKEILYAGRSKTEFFAAVESLNLPKKPDLCDSLVNINTQQNKVNKTNDINIIKSEKSIKIHVYKKDMYKIKLYAFNGKCIKNINTKSYSKGIHQIFRRNITGILIIQITNSKGKLIINKTINF